MSREAILKRLVESKMAAGLKEKALCVCLARRAPNLAGEQPAPSSNPKR
jgi:hypothetical protein